MLTMSNAASLLTVLKDSPSPQVRNDLEFRINTALLYWEQEGEEYNEKERQSEILTTMDELSSGLCIPCLSSEHELVGFVSIRDARFEGAFTYEEVILMMRVAAQVAVTRENSRLFEKVKARERLAVLGEMSAGLAHEIRNPLNAIGLNLELLEEDMELLTESEEPQAVLQATMAQVEHLTSITEEYLRFARLPTPQLEMAQANEMLQELMEFLSEEMNNQEVHWELDLEPALPDIPFDVRQIRQAILNLVRNAMEAASMHKDAHIWLRTRVETFGDAKKPHVCIAHRTLGRRACGLLPRVL